MSDENTKLLLEMITALGVFLGPIVLALLNWWIARNVAKKVEEARVVLANENTKVSDKLEVIRTLVNSKMEKQLEISATALRQVADTTKLPAAIAAAELAERLLAEHRKQQAFVDEEKKK
jgi:hypothetical protein